MVYKLFNLRILPCAFFLFFLSSCLSSKDIILLQSDDPDEEIFYNRPKEYKVLAYDVLVLSVSSPYPTLSKNIAPIFGGSSSYDVLKDGFIDVPLLGKIFVEGKTISEVQKIMESEISHFFDVSKLRIRVAMGGNVTFIGQVNTQIGIGMRPLHIIEAIAQIGGLPTGCNRKKIEIIRQYPKMSKKIYVDVTDVDIMKSVNYWLRPNDIVNLHPLPRTLWGTSVSIFNTFIGSISTFTNLFLTYYLIRDRIAN